MCWRRVSLTEATVHGDLLIFFGIVFKFSFLLRSQQEPCLGKPDKGNCRMLTVCWMLDQSDDGCYCLMCCCCRTSTSINASSPTFYSFPTLINRKRTSCGRICETCFAILLVPLCTVFSFSTHDRATRSHLEDFHF